MHHIHQYDPGYHGYMRILHVRRQTQPAAMAWGGSGRFGSLFGNVGKEEK